MSKSIFICQSCGAEHRKWAGQCPDCNEWNCIVEQSETPITARVGTKGKV
ncbi:MAG: DNA repair protein RadA, partial [Mariprofundaceae bacterium]